MKKERKHTKKQLWIWLSAGILALACAVAAVIVFWQPAFKPESTGVHEPVNSLPKTLGKLLYFREGNAYLYGPEGETLIETGLYSTENPTAAESLEYAFDNQTGTTVYIFPEKDGTKSLKMFKDGKTSVLAKNVHNKCSVYNYERVAYIIKPDTTANTGILMLYMNGEHKVLATGIQLGSVRFTPDGTKVFALRGTAGQNTANPVLVFDVTVEKPEAKTVAEDADSITWVSAEGTAVLTAAQASTQLANCTLASPAGKKEFSNVFLTAPSPDGSMVYLLADFDLEKQVGNIIAIDVKTLNTKTLATDAVMFSPTAATNMTKGIVYAAKNDTEETVDVYFASIEGYKLRLAKECAQSTLYTVAINTDAQTGYILVKQNTDQRNGLFRISYNNRKLQSDAMDSGAIYEIIYYEETDTVTYIKNGTKNIAELYLGFPNGSNKLVSEAAGAIFDAYSYTYYGTSVLAGDAKSLMMFTQLVVTENVSDGEFANHPTAMIYGSLNLYDVATGTSLLISENVRADSFDTVLANSAMDTLYYLQLKGASYNLYAYQNGHSKLVAENVDGYNG